MGCLEGCRGVGGAVEGVRVPVGCWVPTLRPALWSQAGSGVGSMAGSTAGDVTGGGRVRALQQEVEGVKTIMTQNVERILARGENLEQLHSKSQDLEATVQAGGPWGGQRVPGAGRGSPGWHHIPRWVHHPWVGAASVTLDGRGSPR